MNHNVADETRAFDHRCPAPPTASALFDRAREQLEAGNYDSLVDTGRRLVELHPRKPSGFNLLAQALLHLSRTEEALQVVHCGLEKHPTEPKLQTLLVRLLLATDNAPAVVEYAARLAAEGQALPGAALRQIGTFQLQARDFDAARVTGEQLVSRESQAPGSFCLLAQALLCLNEPNEALEVLVHGMAMHPQDQRLHKLAYHAHVLLADTESALAAALTLLKMRPSDERAHYWAYLSLMSLARFDEAEQLLDASREEAPHFWAKYSSHFAQYKSLAVTWPAITAAWEAGLRNRPTHEAVASNADIQIDTIQYWSQGEPSSDLKLVIAQWNQVLRSIGLAEVHVHDRESAGAWITANAPEFQKAFSEAFHFAIEADILRIAYASKKECIYIDIDSWPLAHCERILRQGLAESHSTLYFRAGQPSLNNSFLIARRGCKFFAELASQCASIELSSLPQNQMTVLQSFGPLRYESVLRTLIEREGVETVDAPEGVPAVSKLSFGDGAALLFANEFALAAQKPPFALDYRSTSDNWRGVSESTTAAATSEC